MRPGLGKTMVYVDEDASMSSLTLSRSFCSLADVSGLGNSVVYVNEDVSGFIGMADARVDDAWIGVTGRVDTDSVGAADVGADDACV